MSQLFLYHLTLKSPSLSLHSVCGQYAGKEWHIVVSSGSSLDTYRVDADTGKLQRIAQQNAFAHVTALATLRGRSGENDLLVVLADSGNLVVCELDAATNTFVPRGTAAVAKAGATRLSPIAYVAPNPRSRLVMVAAVERTKLVFNIDHIHQAPVEHVAKDTWTLGVVALDSAGDNSVWAALETTADSHTALNYYVLDHGLNHLFVRPAAVQMDSPSLLVPMPAPFGGVLVCCRNYVVYEPGPGAAAGHGADAGADKAGPLSGGAGAENAYVALPVRRHEESTLITAAHVHTLKKNDFFVLLQSTGGDLFKLTASRDAGVQLRVAYFDSIPPCSSFNVLKSGFLYANTLSHDKLLYQFESLGEESAATCESQAAVPPVTYFDPVGLQHLALVDVVAALGPLVDATFSATGPTSTSATGTGPTGTGPTGTSTDTSALHMLSARALKSLTPGFPITPLVASPLPHQPSVLYTAKLFRDSPTDQYLVMSSARDESTYVLSLGEVVEEVDSVLVKDQYTLGVQQTGRQSLVQVHRNGIRSIRHVAEHGAVSVASYSDWFPPAGISVLHCSSNNQQVVVALSNREVVYFEVDADDDQLVEYQERMQVSQGSVTAVALDVHAAKSAFAAVACSDLSVQVVSLAPHNCFSVLTLQAVSFACRSLLLASPFLHMGMDNGVYVRVSVDAVSGKLSDTRSKYLGAKPVHLRPFNLPNAARPGILAISARPWIGYFDAAANLRLSPLLGCSISCGSSFFSEDIGIDSAVGIDGANLTIFTVGEDGAFDASSDFQISSTKLRYQPRKWACSNRLVFVAEAEADTVSPYAGENISHISEDTSNAGDDVSPAGADVDPDYYDALGYTRAPGRWASCVQVVDPARRQVLHTVELHDNESAGCICADGRGHVIVSSAKDVSPVPPRSSASYISVFRVENNALRLLHKTPAEPVTAMAAFSGGRILVASHDRLRLYEIGKKQVLQKSVTRLAYLRRVSHILYVGADTVVVGDGQASVSYLRLDAGTNQFRPLIADAVPRQITALASLDPRTVVAGDKFGNVCVNRIPAETARDFAENVLSQFQDDFLGGPGARLEKECEFHLSDIPTSFSKGSFVAGSTEAVVYTGLQGTVGMFLPMATVQEANMMVRLETLLREVLDPELEPPSKLNLVGRAHLKFRGYYNPVKNVVDGDFVELFYRLDQATKVKVAGRLDRTPREIERKLYDLRNRGAF